MRTFSNHVKLMMRDGRRLDFKNVKSIKAARKLAGKRNNGNLGRATWFDSSGLRHTINLRQVHEGSLLKNVSIKSRK